MTSLNWVGYFRAFRNRKSVIRRQLFIAFDEIVSQKPFIYERINKLRTIAWKVTFKPDNVCTIEVVSRFQPSRSSFVIRFYQRFCHKNSAEIFSLLLTIPLLIDSMKSNGVLCIRKCT